MDDVWSQNRYIVLTLSFIFPDGIAQKIFNYRKEIEFQDAREEHMRDCALYRVGENICNLVMECSFNDEYKINCLNETLKHVDYSILNTRLYNEYNKVLPRRFDLSLCSSIPSHILDNVLKRKRERKSRAIWEMCQRLNIYILRGSWIEDQGYQYYNYNGMITTPVIKMNDYINKQRFIQGINNTSFHKKDIEKLRNKVSITSMKRDQKIKNKFKRNDAHLFKKKHFKGQKRIK